MQDYSKIGYLLKRYKKILSVYGLGNVGGAIAAVWLRAGAKVIGVDVSENLLLEIKNGKSHKKEQFISKTFTKYLKNQNFILTTNGVEASKKSDIKIIAVPVGLKGNKPDLTIIKNVSRVIAKGLKKKDAVLISPTLPPGTCKNVIQPILENYSKLKAERDFFLIYNPERIFEGRAVKDIESNYPAIIAGLGKKSLEFAEKLLTLISKRGVIKMSSLETAEAEKLFEGVYRDVNIALANELADFSERAGIDYWEAKKGANSQPFCHLHYPGTGVGGFCIPIYPKFVIDAASKIGKSMRILEYSRMINDTMPKKCVIDALKLLSQNKRKQKNTKIAVLGLGFRGEVTDSRLSPTYVVVREFLKKGYEISVHDPYILKDKDLPKSVLLSNDLNLVIKNADLVFISSDHEMYSKLSTRSFIQAKKPLIIFDGRNILKNKNFKNAKIKTIGRSFYEL